MERKVQLLEGAIEAAVEKVNSYKFEAVKSHRYEAFADNADIKDLHQQLQAKQLEISHYKKEIKQKTS